MRKVLMLLLGVFVLCTQLLAQNRVVTGTVTDETGAPIPGASVLLRGTKQGTVTATNGSFSITVPSNATTLVISSVNFDALNVAIGSSPLSVQLKSRINPLDEVVVVGYQQTRKKRDEAGAISSIQAKQLENKPNVSLDKAMQGRAAGVFVQANNGIPGGAINVRIRGAGSINAGNSPLYIVDGLQLNTRNDANFTQSNPLAFLNPDDIQSIDIIKDAASAAIYGSNAANGVVIITTKKGRAGKTKFNFNTYYGTASPLKHLDVTNSQEYYQLRLEATANANNLPVNSLAAKRAVLNELRVVGAAGFDDKQADSAAAALKTYDWQDAALRNGNVRNYELSVSGGNDKTNFRLSANITKQETIVQKVDFNRMGLKADISNKATDRLTIGSSLNISTFDQKLPFATDGSFLGNPAFAASGIIPAFPIYNQDGTYYGVPGGVPFANLGGTLNQNIIQVNDLNSGSQRTNQLVTNLTTDYRITDWLSAKLFGGLDYRIVQGKSVRDARTADAFVRKGLVQVQSNWNTNVHTYGTLNFNKLFVEKHRVTAIAGYEYRQENNASITAAGDGFPTYQFTSLQNAANPVSNSEFFTGFRRNAVFGSLDYGYDSRYIIGLVARYDGSSRFGKGNRYGVFSGIKGAWNVDQENFMKSVKPVSSLKLRASYGTVGNDQIGNFDGLGLFGGGGIYNGGAGIAYTQLENPNLKWESTTISNFGIDLGLLDNRLTIIGEVYNKQTKDVLLNLPLQSTTGFTSIAYNIGKTENKGVELTLIADILRSRQVGGLNWNINFNFAHNKQKVKELYDNNQVLPGDASLRVGQPFGVLYTQKYAGVNAATGRPMWYDSLGNITYIVQAKDRVVLGPTQLAPYYGGLTNTISYKGFSLEGTFSYEYGRYSSDGQVNFLRESSGRINFLRDIYDNRWTTPGQVTSVPRQNLLAESKSSGGASGNRTWFKADYIRLRNVMLSYELPTSIIRKARLTNARFYVQGTNLWTYSDWFSYDIEFVGTTSTGIIPQTRNVTVGLTVGF